jgi:transcriptional regulator with XRE-family HTH domain
MSKKLENYLRAHRKRSGLSQDEVAFLLGSRSGTKVSRYESFARTPGLRTALALAVIFRASAREIFAGLFEEEAQRAASQARLLSARLSEDNASRKTTRKLITLKASIATVRKKP